MTAAALLHIDRTPAPLDVARLRADFPILATRINGQPLAYLDNASTGQRPRRVIEAMREFDADGNANVHRGVHTLSQRATERFDHVREQVRRFIGARQSTEIVYTHGTTGSINLVARSYGRSVLRPGDEILLTQMEHHSNIVPWQLLREETSAVLKVIPVTSTGELDLDEAARLVTARTRIVSVTHMSNVLGTINPIRTLADLAHAAGAIIVVDGAQSIGHIPIDVSALDCDFFAASGHKMFGPTGIGILYGREALLEQMQPVEGGGGMIDRVTFERTTWAPVPIRFEAGTPPISAVIGLGAAIEYLEALSLAAIESTEAELLQYAIDRLSEVPDLRLIGAAARRSSVISFMLGSVHPHDVGTVLDTHGVAIRAGHHCAQPLMGALGVPGTARASLSVYNTREEIDRMVAALHVARSIFN